MCMADADQPIQFNTASDAAEKITAWTRHLRVEKQVSPHTLDAYIRDITQFTPLSVSAPGQACVPA